MGSSRASNNQESFSSSSSAVVVEETSPTTARKPRQAAVLPKSLPILTSTDVTLGEALGKGGFSEVFAVTATSADCELPAAKIVVKHVREDKLSKLTRDELKREALLLSQFHHPNIIQVLALIGQPGTDEFGLVLERCEESLLERMDSWCLLKRRNSRRISFTKRRRNETMTSALRLFRQQLAVIDELAAAVEYLHLRSIMYRDLKPENCGFVGGALKVFDFGAAVQLQSESEVQMLLIGTHPYCAKELALGRQCGVKVDVYSVGIMAWELINTTEPFGDLMSHEYVDQVIHRGRRPKLDPKWPEELRGMLKQCWSPEPSDRPTIVQVREVLHHLMHDASGSSSTTMLAVE